MPPSSADYRRLHELHRELKKIQDQLDRGPRQIKARQSRVDGVQAELLVKEAELKDLRTLADRKNLDLKSKETHLGDLQAKLNAASSNREYEIIQGQINADMAAKAVLEDEVLEALDRVDNTQSEIDSIKQQIQDLSQQTQDFANEFESQVVDLQKQETKTREQIKAAETIIPNEIREQYHRLVEAYGADAMAECSGGVCTNCFVQMTPQSKVLLNSGNLLFCGSCGRLLYQDD